MGFDQIILNAGVLLLSLSIGYILWVCVRVAALRDELFAIRDELFDTVRSIDGGLQDPAYRQCRNRINGAIRTAGTINIATMVYLIAVQHEGVNVLRSDDPKVQDAINKAWHATIIIILRYISRRTLLGITLSAMVVFIPAPLIRSKTLSMLSKRDIDVTGGNAPLAAA